MFIRKDRHQLASGESETYLSLAHNVTEVTANGSKRTKPVIFAQLGPESKLDVPVVRGMRNALDRYLEQRIAREAAASNASAADVIGDVAVETRKVAHQLKLMGSREFGLPLLFRRAWTALGLDKVLQKACTVAPRAWDFEGVVAAMVLHRIVDPGSKLACNDWIADRAWFPEADGWTVEHMYRALDALVDAWPAVEKHMLGQMPDTGDELWCLADTTSSCFETDLDDNERAALRALLANDGVQPETPPEVDALRKRGHSKDHRPDLPQIVIGLAADKHGFPRLLSIYAGNTADASTTLDLVNRFQAATDKKLVVAADGGMTGNPNLKELAARGVHWVTAARSDADGFGVKLLLDGPGRWASHPTRKGLTFRAKVVPAKEGKTGVAEVWILTRNAAEVRRLTAKQDQKIATAQTALEENNKANGRGAPAHATLRRSGIRPLVKKQGDIFVLDEEFVKERTRLFGLHVVRSSLVEREPVEILDGYQRLLAVEGNFRTLKGTVRLRPMYHHAPNRVRAHVMVCFLALVCARWLETESGMTLRRLRDLFGGVRASLVELDGHTFWQREEWSKEALAVLEKLGIEPGPSLWPKGTQPRPGSNAAHAGPTP